MRMRDVILFNEQKTVHNLSNSDFSIAIRSKCLPLAKVALEPKALGNVKRLDNTALDLLATRALAS